MYIPSITHALLTVIHVALPAHDEKERGGEGGREGEGGGGGRRTYGPIIYI